MANTRVEFTVMGIPKGKGRPRFSTFGGHVSVHTPPETALYENLVRLSYQRAHPHVMLEGAIGAEITAYFPIPKSASRKARERMLSGEERHSKKVDCDNLAKVILDSLNGIAYRDDGQVSELAVRKLYGHEPRVEVVLAELI